MVPYGDRDALGLFQEWPSQGWGTPTQIMDPACAATAYNTALVQVPDWQSLPLTVAAQQVQHSGAPTAYAKHETLAIAILAALPAGTCPAPRYVPGTCCSSAPPPTSTTSAST